MNRTFAPAVWTIIVVSASFTLGCASGRIGGFSKSPTGEFTVDLSIAHSGPLQQEGTRIFDICLYQKGDDPKQWQHWRYRIKGCHADIEVNWISNTSLRLILYDFGLGILAPPGSQGLGLPKRILKIVAFSWDETSKRFVESR